jgi:hypothetical protein
MAPNLHQTRLAALSNSLHGVDMIRATTKAVAGVDTTPPLTSIDSDTYWEWRSESDNTLFAADRIIANIQKKQQHERQKDAAVSTECNGFVNPDHDAYWAEKRFPAEEEKYASESVSESPMTTMTSCNAQLHAAAAAAAPLYWDDAVHTLTKSDAYWQW